jgi:hypothetical protein
MTERLRLVPQVDELLLEKARELGPEKIPVSARPHARHADRGMHAKLDQRHGVPKMLRDNDRLPL